MKTRIIRTKIHNSPEFDRLDNEEKYLCLYLYTSPEIAFTGYYYLPDKKIEYIMGWSKKHVQQVKEKLHRLGLAGFSNDWVYVPDKFAVFGFGGSKIEESIKREKDSIPQQVRENTSMDGSMDTSMYTNHKSKTINHKSKTKNKNKEITKKLVNVYNELFDRNLRVTDKKVSMVRVRLKTYSPEELEQAIVKCSKSPFHRGENDRNWVANFEYMYRNDNQVDKCLNLGVPTGKARGGVAKI